MRLSPILPNFAGFFPRASVYQQRLVLLYINEKLCFYSIQIRTLVAMATYSSHRLIMGKEEIDKFFCLIGDIWKIFFTEMFIE